ncbi:hypothetical protein EVAR_9574_1 [Eumeta japonica]|uniref:Uncharacterized protein n=1 Tax=Eumeta variegata TaxID=151549 RepID=A0A4C1TMR1_EUMVA|nr:hypothetical protein EVAR_9574_1 [Eumeta japonica]
MPTSTRSADSHLHKVGQTSTFDTQRTKITTTSYRNNGASASELAQFIEWWSSTDSSACDIPSTRASVWLTGKLTVNTYRMRTGKRNRHRRPDSPDPNPKSKRDDISINQLT